MKTAQRQYICKNRKNIMFTKFQPLAFMTKFSQQTLGMIFIIFQQKL